MSISSESKMVMNFGKGDIIISTAYDNKKMDGIPFVMFSNGAEGHIGDRPEFEGTVIEDWSLKMFFDKVESVDSVIATLNDYKKKRFG